MSAEETANDNGRARKNEQARAPTNTIPVGLRRDLVVARGHGLATDYTLFVIELRSRRSEEAASRDSGGVRHEAAEIDLAVMSDFAAELDFNQTDLTGDLIRRALLTRLRKGRAKALDRARVPAKSRTVDRLKYFELSGREVARSTIP